MFIFFFLLWIILNGRITLEIVLFGLAIAALITTVVRRMTPLSAENERMLFRNAPLLLVYVLNLILEIIKASLQVMTVIWNPAKQPDPVIVEFDSGLNSAFANILLANSITLTPGTITLDQKNGHFVIHCLRKEYADGMGDLSFLRLLRRLK